MLTENNLNQIPSELGFKMPAEWEPHEATWLTWPRDLETWPKELEAVEDTYLEMIEQLHLGERVNILVNDAQCQDYVSKKLKEHGIIKNVLLYLLETDSIWIRDYGPIFITQPSGKRSLTNWLFNAWGGKYPFQKDNLVQAKMAEILNLEQFKADAVLEGGSIDVNGAGTLITTEECLLNQNRNPYFNRERIEQYLKDFLGVAKIIWLGKGIEGDDTDGHVDEIARFVSVNRIVISVDQNVQSYNHKILAENFSRLKNETDQDGKPFQLIELPLPAKIKSGKFALPASYANFYIANKCVLVPIFGDPNDSKALDILEDLFPDRKIVGITAIPLIYGQGAIHCVTQQEPAHAA